MGRVKLLKITRGTFCRYVDKVKDNDNDLYADARKKLTRNWLLGRKMDSDEYYEWRRYGNLFMCLDKEINTIIWLENIKGLKKTNFQVDMELKKKIEEDLGI